MRQAAGLGLAYLHVMRAPTPAIDAFALAREHFGGRLILNDGFDAASAEQALADGAGDAVSFARHYIGNPDLVRRFREDRRWPVSTARRCIRRAPGLQRLPACLTEPARGRGVAPP